MSREYFAKVNFIEYQRFIYAPFSYDIQGYVLTNSYVTNVGLLISLFLFCRRWNHTVQNKNSFTQNTCISWFYILDLDFFASIKPKGPEVALCWHMCRRALLSITTSILASTGISFLTDFYAIGTHNTFKNWVYTKWGNTAKWENLWEDLLLTKSIIQCITLI